MLTQCVQKRHLPKFNILLWLKILNKLRVGRQHPAVTKAMYKEPRAGYTFRGEKQRDRKRERMLTITVSISYTTRGYCRSNQARKINRGFQQKEIQNLVKLQCCPLWFLDTKSLMWPETDQARLAGRVLMIYLPLSSSLALGLHAYITMRGFVVQQGF